MRATIKKWGNSASVRTPASVLKAANLRLDEPVDVRKQSGVIVIEPVGSREYELRKLLREITPKNLHEEIEFGGPVGNEA